MYIIQPMQKKSKTVQKMISYASQYSLPVGGLRAVFYQARNSFFNTEFGARHLSPQSCYRAANIRMIAVLGRKVPPDDFFPPMFARYVFQRGIDQIGRASCRERV